VQEHLDPDRLILLALAESVPEIAETVHLTECPECRVEIDSLRHVADLGSESQELGHLPPPPERVWLGIAAEVAQMERPAIRPTRRARRAERRWVAPLVAALAAAVVGIAGTAAVARFTGRESTAAVTAHADLSRLPIAPAAAHGEAQIVASDRLRLEVRDLPLTTGYYQVWLMNPEDLSQMVPVGIIRPEDPETVLPIAPTTNLNRYRLIDVSAQAYGGNGTHSGKSLLRGTLTN
jgi:hypothetical protein